MVSQDVWTVMLSGDDEASMQYLYELFSTPGSCDSSFLISKTEYRTYEINSDEDRKELYDSVKSTYCKD